MARFIGPLRPVVPAIAGMMNMPPARFLVIDCIACLLWAPVYILPGMVFGASLGLAAEVAGRLVVLLLIMAGMAWIGVWLSSSIIRLLQPHARSGIEKLLDWSRNHPHIRPLAGSLLDPEHPEARGLAILSVLFLITLWLLLLIWRQVLHGQFIGGIDAYVFHAFDSLRTPWADSVMLFFTRLGDPWVLAAIMLTCGAWLVVKGNTKAALHWLAVYACAGLLTWILKISARVPRPTEFTDGFAFPSSHTGMSVAVYGFLALLIARELPHQRRWLPYFGAGCLVAPIALSRLYLGAHWFSDILAGLTLGIFWVALIGIAYDRHPAPGLPVRRLLLMSIAVTAIATAMPFGRTTQEADYAQGPASLQRVTPETWRNLVWQQLPGWRIDLEGSREQPLNVQWAGSLDELSTLLGNLGWYQPAALSPATALNWLAPEPSIDRLPVLPEVNDGEHQQLTLLAPHGHGDRHLTILRLWPSSFELLGGDVPVWVGKVSYQYLDTTLPLISYLRTADDFNGPLRQLAAALQESTGIRTAWRQRRLAGNAGGPGWHGDVLLAWRFR